MSLWKHGIFWMENMLWGLFHWEREVLKLGWTAELAVFENIYSIKSTLLGLRLRYRYFKNNFLLVPSKKSRRILTATKFEKDLLKIGYFLVKWSLFLWEILSKLFQGHLHISFAPGEKPVKKWKNENKYNNSLSIINMW